MRASKRRPRDRYLGEASSGVRTRHRLNPRGNRIINHAIHIAASVDAAMPAALSSSSTAFVAETDGAVVGWVHGYESVLLQYPYPFVEIGGLVVDHEARGTGIGRALMKAVEQWATDRGLAEVRLRSGAVRLDAHQFYESLGYLNEKATLTFSKRLR